MLRIQITNNDCPLHTQSLRPCRNQKCVCSTSVTRDDDGKVTENGTVFNTTPSALAHLKYLNILNGKYDEKAFAKFVKYLTVYRSKTLRLNYVVKIVSTIVRYVKYIEQFDATQCVHMLNKYNMVKLSYFKNLLRDELSTLPKHQQLAYLQLNATRSLALDSDTIQSMIQKSVEWLKKARQTWRDNNDSGRTKSFLADVVFYTLILLSFYTGARTMATLCRLMLCEYKMLLVDGQVDTLGKNNVIITVYLVENIRQKYMPLLQLLPDIVTRAPNCDPNKYIFTDNCTTKQLHLRFDKLYNSICPVTSRPEWVKWHAARRWFLGEIYSHCGIKVASKAVSHQNIKTTMRYVQASTHCKDVHRHLNRVFSVAQNDRKRH